MTKTKTVSILNIVMFIITIAINALAMIGLFGNTTANIANAIPNLMMPIGMTFQIIWTLIYILLAIYTGYQYVERDREDIRRIGVLYLVTNILNMAWVLTFGAELLLVSTIIIIGLFATLYVIVHEIDNSNKFVKTTFNIYYAWITVASVVSIFTYISSLSPTLFDSTLIKLTAVGSMVILVILTYLRRKEFGYSLTILFAIIGILAKHIFEYKSAYPEIVTMGIIVVILGIFISLISFIELNSPKSRKLIKTGAK